MCKERQGEGEWVEGRRERTTEVMIEVFMFGLYHLFSCIYFSVHWSVSIPLRKTKSHFVLNLDMRLVGVSQPDHNC